MPVRDLNNKLIFGVCSGLSEYFNIEVNIIRIVFVLGIFAGGISFILYLILAIIMPTTMDPKTNNSEKTNKKSSKIESKIIDRTKTTNLNINYDKRNGSYFLILLGILILLSNTNFLHILTSTLFWGLVFIIFGILSILSKRRLSFVQILLIFILVMILALALQWLFKYLSTTLPYPFNGYL
ncbi:MAG: PspC domain-containing protein [Patescibacteria group bacterium]